MNRSGARLADRSPLPRPANDLRAAPPADHWVLGSKVTDLTLDQLLDEVDRAVATGGFETILNTNVHGVLLARRLPWLAEFRNAARIIHCDGGGLVLGARLLGLPLGERLCVNDFIWPLARHCRARGHSLYLLGGEAEDVEAAARALAEAVPGVRIAGHHHGYFDKHGEANDRVVAAINAARPNVLLVGFGMPLQERWLRDNAARLEVDVVMLVGGFYKRLSGRVPFAPRWMTANGLEWLYLSLRDPRRFFQRYLVENPAFLALVLLQRLGVVAGGGASARRRSFQ